METEILEWEETCRVFTRIAGPSYMDNTEALDSGAPGVQATGGVMERKMTPSGVQAGFTSAKPPVMSLEEILMPQKEK